MNAIINSEFTETNMLAAWASDAAIRKEEKHASRMAAWHMWATNMALLRSLHAEVAPIIALREQAIAYMDNGKYAQ